MTQNDPTLVVSTDWLQSHLKDPSLRVIDASWHLPTVGRDGEAEYRNQHIEGAVFFDIDKISDQSSPLPHMVPSAEQFARDVGNLGISNAHQIVVYDSLGLFSAARVWWLFRYMGHFDVCVLDGGLPRWIEEGRPLSRKATRREKAHMVPHEQSDMVRDVTAVHKVTVNGEEKIIDARPKARFLGEEEEPRPGLRRGHMKGAVNIPYDSLLNEDGTLKNRSQLEQIFDESGVTFDEPVITSCGSGVTAAVISLALEIIGHPNHALYDGAWAEWGGRDDLVVIGP